MFTQRRVTVSPDGKLAAMEYSGMKSINGRRTSWQGQVEAVFLAVNPTDLDDKPKTANDSRKQGRFGRKMALVCPKADKGALAWRVGVLGGGIKREERMGVGHRSPVEMVGVVKIVARNVMAQIKHQEHHARNLSYFSHISSKNTCYFQMDP